MATELSIHAYLDGLFDRWGRAGNAHGRQNGRLYKMAKRLKNATAVIDMGERSVDTNRWVLDTACSRLQNTLCAFGQQGVRRLYERVGGKTVSDAAKASGR